jgi:hypothetical protein
VTLHTDIPTRAEVERLLDVRDAACVSIYLPTSEIPQETQADRIELRNLAGAAAEQLTAAGADRDAVGEIGDALAALEEDDDFWSEQARSLAVFASPAGVRTFRLPNRLTAHVEVGDRFYVKPLLRTITFPQAAFVLALASGSVRLVEVTAEGAPFVVDVPGLPTAAADPAGEGTVGERSPQMARMRGEEGQKVRLRQYARGVDQALRGVLTGLELPLILAATEPLESIYRSLNSYPHLAEAGIAGNPENTTEADLAAAARALLDELYARELAKLGEAFGQRFAQDRASSDLATIARAATYGAVGTLLVDIDEKVPGQVDEETGEMTLAPDDAASYGVTDEIARRVRLNGGRALAVRGPDVPGGGPVAAILRYPIAGVQAS